MWDDARQLNGVSIALAACAAVALVVAALAWLVRQPMFAFREVVIATPLARASGPHLESVVREELTGTFFTLDLDRASSALERVPWVQSVALRRQWPRRLEIDVVEHEPVARWNDASLVDARGVVFNAEWDGELPEFFGPDGQSAAVTARYREWSQTLAPLGLAIHSLTLSSRGGWQIVAIRAAGPSQGADDAAPGRPKPRRVQLPTPSPSGGSAAAKAASVGAHIRLTIELGRDDPAGRLARFVAVHERTIGALDRSGRHIEQVDLRYRNGFAARVPGFREKPVKKS